MLCRRSFTGSTLVLLACLAVLPACKKKQTGGGDSTQPAPGPVAGTPAAAVSSDYVLFAHLKAKDIRDSAIFAEVQQAVAKAGGKAEWDKVEGEAVEKIGVKPTDIDSVSVFITEFPAGPVPKFVVILAAAKPINKAGVFDIGKTKPDDRGFYTSRGAPGLFHFPDDRTLVMLHPELKQKYLDGYAKNRTGWPMTADLARAASVHTLFAVVHADRVPDKMVRGPEAQMVAPLLAARTVTLTADLKGKELSVAARATFPDAASAGKAKELVQGFIGMGTGFIENFMKSKEAADLSAAMPVVQEAHRALKEAKVEVSGSDLIVAGSYRANFDISAMMAGVVPKMQAAAARTTAQNHLKQVGLGLHNYASAYGNQVPVYALGAKGMPLKTPTDKPLLSWRVALLPYMEEQALYNQFKLDEAWDSPNNKKLIEKMPKIYTPVNKAGKPGYTHLQMVIGPNAMQPPSVRFPASFPDGMSNTIAVVEAAEPVIWTKPDDVMLSGKELPKDLKKKFGGQFPNGFNVVMWDGSVRFVSNTINDRTLGLALNPKDGQPLPNDW